MTSAALVLTLVGCAPEPEPHAEETSHRYLVAEAALHHMIDEASSKNVESSAGANVIEAGEFTSRLVKTFAGHQPKVIENVAGSSSGCPSLDPETGKPFTFWSVSVGEVLEDRAAAGVSVRYPGAFVGYTLTLHKNAGKWKVETESVGMVADFPPCRAAG